MDRRIIFITSDNHNRRGVAFLVADDKKIDAHRFYDHLPEDDPIGLTFNVRFDNWQEGKQIRPHQFHRWDKNEFGSRYTSCFVFKCQEHRLYGFLCNPREENHRYQLCVLVVHSTKHQDNTVESHLRFVLKTSKEFMTLRAIDKYFKEKK